MTRPHLAQLLAWVEEDRAQAIHGQETPDQQPLKGFGRACREISATADTTPRGDPVSAGEGLVLAGSPGFDC